MFAGDFHGLPGVAEQGSETDRPFVSGAAPEIAVFQRAVVGGEQNDGVVFALPAEAEGFSGADEIGDRLHPADLFHARGTVPVLGDVVLESAAHRQDRRRFLHDLNGMLRHAGQFQGTVGRAEIPGHQVPGHVLLGDGASRVPGDVERVAGIEVAREEIHVRGDRLRHVVGVRPVGGDLEIGVFPVDLVDIIADVAAEQFPAEFPVFLEERIPGLYRKTAVERDSRFLLERGDRIGMIIHRCPPAFAVHPYAVGSVSSREFFQLRNEEHIGVMSCRPDHAVQWIPLSVPDRFFGMVRAEAAVDHAGIVQIEGDAFLPRHFPPQSQRVKGEFRHGVFQFRRIGRPSGMPLAVDLDKIGPDQRADFPDIFLPQSRSDDEPGGGAGVKVKMQTERAFRSSFHEMTPP